MYMCVQMWSTLHICTQPPQAYMRGMCTSIHANRQSYMQVHKREHTDTVQARYTHTTTQVEPSPFVTHKTKSWLGATPDGTVGESGLVEIKAPVYKLYGDVPAHYMAQVRHTCMYSSFVGNVSCFGPCVCVRVCVCVCVCV